MLGASGVIFGLLAICLVWAPMNEVVCIIWFRFTPSVFDVSILWFVAGYIALDICFVEPDRGGHGQCAQPLHERRSSRSCLTTRSSAILGFVVAVVLLKLGWVDCENWDLFAVLEGRKGQSKAAARRAKSRMPMVSAEFRRKRSGEAENARARKRRARSRRSRMPAAAALRTMRLHLELGEVEAALAVYNKSSRSLSAWQPAEADWLDLIQALLGVNAWGDAAPVMRDYVQRSATAVSPRAAEAGPGLDPEAGSPLAGTQHPGSDSRGLAARVAREDSAETRSTGRANARGRRPRLQDEMW